MPAHGRPGGPGLAASSALAAILAALLPIPAPGAGPIPPAAGRVLVATTQLAGSYFERSVILLLDHDRDGSVGVVVNRPSSVPVSEVLVEPDLAGNRADLLQQGGPVSMETTTVLVRRSGEGAGVEGVQDVDGADGIGRVVSEPALREVLAEPGTELRIYAGYAGWGPGQLDFEIERGSWHVLGAEPGWVFSEEPGELWETLRKLASRPLV